MRLLTPAERLANAREHCRIAIWVLRDSRGWWARRRNLTDFTRARQAYPEAQFEAKQ